MRLSEKVIFDYNNGKYVLVEVVDEVDGKKVTKVLRKKDVDVVTIIAIDDKGRLIMEKQYRPAVRDNNEQNKDNRGWVYELPGGKIEKGEKPEIAAARELEEETGYKAKSVKLLYDRLLAPWASSSTDYVCVATGLVKTKTNMDEDEIIEIYSLEKDRVFDMIKDGSINDTATREALLYWQYSQGSIN